MTDGLHARLWLLCLVGSCLLPSYAAADASADDGRRVLRRDTQTSGATGVSAEDLEPLFDGGLRRALRALDSGDGTPAIDALRHWIDEHPSDPRLFAARLSLGYALFEEKRYDEAMEPLTACAAAGQWLSNHCTWWQARIAQERERWSQSATFAAAVDPSSVFGPRARYLYAVSKLEAGDVAEATRKLEEFLVAYPNASYRPDVEMTLARAYEAGDDLDAAARLYHRVSVLHPGEEVERRAERRLTELRPLLSEAIRSEVGSPSTVEAVERASVLFDRHRSEQVVDMLDDLVGSMRPGSDTACQARFLIGKSFTKLRRHGEAAPHYDAIASQCSDGDLVVRALYNVARGLWTIDRNADAFDRFRQIWTRFPGSTYADDALLQAARLRRDEGATVEADALLDQLLESYPAGDMRPDALWLRMVEKLHAEDYRGAVALADGVATNPGETDLYSRGRIAYFRARALEGLNLTNEARAGFQQVMRDSPMGYYALLALNRLQAIDRAGARALVEELRTPSDKTEGFIGVRPEVARNEHFRSGVLLLRLGLFDLASSELGQLKADFPNDNEVGWLVAFLYDKVGDYQRSHLVPGKRLDVSLAYPAGSNLDRWHIAFPRPFVDEVNRRSRERRLDPFIVYAIMREESGFSPSIESWANAYGLLQLMLPTANDMAKATGRGRVTARQLFDPTVNIELGTMFMKTLSDAFDGHPALVIGGYNGGAANVRRWIRENGRMPFDLWVEEIPYSQTREYVKRVTMSYWIYRWLYAESDPWVTLPWSLTALMPSGRTN